jgi:hypothetical protein
MGFAAGQQDGSAAGPVALEDRGCREETKLKSLAGDHHTTIQFVNASSEPKQVFWINYDGKRVLYRHLGVSEKYVQPTYSTHPWVVANRAGTCTQIFVGEERDGRATIR